MYKNEYGWWYLGLCNSCHKGVLINQSAGGETFMYPNPLPKPVDDKLPDFIRGDIKELYLCQSVGAHKGTCALARAVLQEVCRRHDAKGKDLNEEIDDLAKNGIITKNIADFAHSIRVVGNDVLHPKDDSREPSKEDGEAILSLLEQIIFNLYIAPQTAREMKEKFKKKKKK
jgi:hypothetical protein